MGNSSIFRNGTAPSGWHQALLKLFELEVRRIRAMFGAHSYPALKARLSGKTLREISERTGKPISTLESQSEVAIKALMEFCAKQDSDAANTLRNVELENLAFEKYCECGGDVARTAGALRKPKGQVLALIRSFLENCHHDVVLRRNGTLVRYADRDPFFKDDQKGTELECVHFGSLPMPVPPKNTEKGDSRSSAEMNPGMNISLRVDNQRLTEPGTYEPPIRKYGDATDRQLLKEMIYRLRQRLRETDGSLTAQEARQWHAAVDEISKTASPKRVAVIRSVLASVTEESEALVAIDSQRSPSERDSEHFKTPAQAGKED